MKKLFAIILTIIYMTTSSGVVVNAHYCMGRLASVKVDNFKNSFCKCGMKAAEKGCCHSRVSVVKLSNLHKAATAVNMSLQPVALLAAKISLLDAGQASLACINACYANGPPLTVFNKIYLQNCVFRI